MKNYHVECPRCRETLSVYAKSIFDAIEDIEQNHLCARFPEPAHEEIMRNESGQIEMIILKGRLVAHAV